MKSRGPMLDEGRAANIFISSFVLSEAGTTCLKSRTAILSFLPFLLASLLLALVGAERRCNHDFPPQASSLAGKYKYLLPSRAVLTLLRWGKGWRIVAQTRGHWRSDGQWWDERQGVLNAWVGVSCSVLIAGCGGRLTIWVPLSNPSVPKLVEVEIAFEKRL